ncbi:MAG: phytanoyl-CoA dioxygenase family protein [Planctomycetales bacterium]
MEFAATSQPRPGHSQSGPLTAEQVSFFERNGYLILPGQVSPAEQQAMLLAAQWGLSHEVGPLEFEAELHYPGAPQSLDAVGGRTIRRLKHAQGRHPVFTEVLSSPAIAGSLQQLLRGRVVLSLAHHNCIMTKQPRFSSETGWHQDIRYWAFERPELISAWLALGPEYPENGCLYVIPGSHRIPLRPEQMDDQIFLREDLAENAPLIAQKVPVELQPGDVLLFHCKTFHAASANHTEATKYSVVFTFRREDNLPLPGTRSATAELLLPDRESANN